MVKIKKNESNTGCVVCNQMKPTYRVILGETPVNVCLADLYELNKEIHRVYNEELCGISSDDSDELDKQIRRLLNAKISNCWTEREEQELIILERSNLSKSHQLELKLIRDY